MREQLEAWVEAHRDEIIAATQGVLQIPSVKADAAGEGAPFGQPVADALTHTLTLCETLGMATENFGGYAGHATFGAGDEIVGMLGHLDVVPAGKDWTYEPWGATLDRGFLWGRGTSDDKGPTYAALWGAKAVLDVAGASGVALSRRIRLIFGCDEESGWECMTHYFGPAKQPKPTVAFTPDAMFPLVYAEKGSFTAVVTKTVEASGASLRLVAFQSGLRSNMVPDEATATLTGESDVVSLAADVLGRVEGVTATQTGETLTVRAQGKSAHGSTPQNGDNAAVKLMRALSSSTSALDELSGADAAWLSDLAVRAAPDGGEIGIGGSDAITGPLTSNMGVVTLENGVVQAAFNVRYPATWDGAATIARLRESVARTGWALPDPAVTAPLYVPQDEEPVKTLLRVYREHTGDLTPPLTMGGRTYATSVAPVGVAYGPSRPGDPETAHQADECFAVERLIECAKIYAHALYELAK